MRYELILNVLDYVQLRVRQIKIPHKWSAKVWKTLIKISVSIFIGKFVIDLILFINGVAMWIKDSLDKLSLQP